MAAQAQRVVAQRIVHPVSLAGAVLSAPPEALADEYGGKPWVFDALAEVSRGHRGD